MPRPHGAGQPGVGSTSWRSRSRRSRLTWLWQRLRRRGLGGRRRAARRGRGPSAAGPWWAAAAAGQHRGRAAAHTARRGRTARHGDVPPRRPRAASAGLQPRHSGPWRPAVRPARRSGRTRRARFPTGPGVVRRGSLDTRCVPSVTPAASPKRRLA